MLRYVFKRILQIIPVLLITAILIFTLMYFVPGDPVQIMMGDFQVSPEQMNEIRERLGLLDPFPVQLLRFCIDGPGRPAQAGKEAVLTGTRLALLLGGAFRLLIQFFFFVSVHAANTSMVTHFDV